jgi:hypothetical protein
MASDQNTPIQLNGPFILDNRYFNGTTGLPWASKAEVLASDTVQEAYRAKGLVVLIGKREWWFRDGTTDNDLVPYGNWDVVLLNNVDGSYVLDDLELLLAIVAIPNNGNITGFKVGFSAGTDEVIPASPLVANKGNAFNTAIYANGNQTLHFSGIAASGTNVVIKIYKH